MTDTLLGVEIEVLRAVEELIVDVEDWVLPEDTISLDCEIETLEDVEVVEVLVVDVEDWVLPEDTISFDCESGGLVCRRT